MPTFTCSFVFSSVNRRCLSQLGPSTWDQHEGGACRGHAGTGHAGKRPASSPGSHPVAVLAGLWLAHP